MTLLFINPDSTPRFYELLQRLPADWSASEYLLCGSATLAARGIRDVNDLDVLVTNSLWGSVVSTFGAQEKKRDYESEQYDDAWTGSPKRRLLFTEGIDFMDLPPCIAGGVTTDMLFAMADAVHYKSGDLKPYKLLLVQNPRHCLAIKALANRSKDHADMISLAQIIKQEEEGKA